MTHHENKIKRRQAIGLAVASCGSVQLLGAFGRPEPDCGDETRRRIRELHLQLLDFNQKLVPKLIDGRGNAPTYDRKRPKRFLHLSLYLRRKLDERSSNSNAAFNAVLLQQRLKQLHVHSRLACTRFDDSVIRHPAMGFLCDQHGKPGNAFASLAWGSTPTRLIATAERICVWLKSPTKGMDAIDAIRGTPIDKLKLAFAVMDRGDFLELVEAQFMIRPETPVSFLKLHSRPLESHVGYLSVLSCICGNLMERLANNHFHQTIAMSRLNECNGSWHGFIAGQVFDILVQKWLWLMRGEKNREPIDSEDAGDLSLAMQRGVVEGIWNASRKKCQSPQTLTNSGR